MYNTFRKTLGAVFGGGKSHQESDDDFVEAEVCAVADVKNGDMKVVEVGEEGKALLVHDKGEFYAVGTKCTHYGAPLEKGALCDGRVRCPWHGACFNVKTGDIEDFPGLDSLPKYEVKIADGRVRVRAKKSMLKSNRVTKPSSCSAVQDKPVFLIVGGGGAGAVCSETLRSEGFQGRIVMATKESCQPYDRPKLSKMLDASPENMFLRKDDLYSKYCIDLMTNKEVISIDVAEKKVSFQDGGSLAYDKLLLATGGKPKTLELPGADLENIFYLRTPEDGNKIAKAANGKDIVIIGSSFIGLEVAAYLAGKASSVTVVGRSEVPLKTVLGEKIGLAVKKILEEKGVKFVFSNPPTEFLSESGTLTHVVLQDGTKLSASACIVGVGVVPSTDYIQNTGIHHKNGYITVNKHMETSVDDVYAAGDIVTFPLFMYGDEHVNVQHWQMAGKQGRTAALAMFGKSEDIRSVPFFWTAISGKSLRFAGYAAGHDDVIIHGDVNELKFVAFYVRQDKVVAVASMNHDPIVAQAAEMFQAGKIITRNEVMDQFDGWCRRLTNG